jgi:hypothetical protein
LLITRAEDTGPSHRKVVTGGKKSGPDSAACDYFLVQVRGAALLRSSAACEMSDPRCRTIRVAARYQFEIDKARVAPNTSGSVTSSPVRRGEETRLAGCASSSRLVDAEDRWLVEPLARSEESVRTARAGESWRKDRRRTRLRLPLVAACAPRAFCLSVRLPTASLSGVKNRQRWRGTLWRGRTRRPPSRS